MRSPGKVKQVLEKRSQDVKDDLERNSDQYDKLNTAIRKLEIMKLEERMLQFN